MRDQDKMSFVVTAKTISAKIDECGIRGQSVWNGFIDRIGTALDHLDRGTRETAMCSAIVKTIRGYQLRHHHGIITTAQLRGSAWVIGERAAQRIIDEGVYTVAESEGALRHAPGRLTADQLDACAEVEPGAALEHATKSLTADQEDDR